MRFKRLYYNPAIHGGSVGIHSLNQGHAIKDSVTCGYMGVRVLQTFSGSAPGDFFSLGTVAQPGTIYTPFEPYYDVTDYVAAILTTTVLIATTSDWAVEVLTNPFTVGLYEFLLPVWNS